MDADRALATFLAELRVWAGDRAAEWRRLSWNVRFQVVYYPMRLIAPGMTNNKMYTAQSVGQGNRDLLRAFNDFRCIAWTANICDKFAKKRRAGVLGSPPAVRMGVAHSLGNTHTFPVIWKHGTHPIADGLIIDCWPKQRWYCAPVTDHLHDGPPSPLRRFQVLEPKISISMSSGATEPDEPHRPPQPQRNPDGTVMRRSDGTIMLVRGGDAGFWECPQLDVDQRLLFEAWSDPTTSALRQRRHIAIPAATAPAATAPAATAPKPGYTSSGEPWSPGSRENVE